MVDVLGRMRWMLFGLLAGSPGRDIAGSGGKTSRLASGGAGVGRGGWTPYAIVCLPGTSGLCGQNRHRECT